MTFVLDVLGLQHYGRIELFIHIPIHAFDMYVNVMAIKTVQLL